MKLRGNRARALVNTLDPNTTSANLIPVVAPFDGVLVRCDIVKGEVVSPEHSSLVLANVEKMLVKFSVNKEDALRVGPGQEVHYMADGIPGRIRCHIRWISTEVDDKTRAVLAIAEVENARLSGHNSPGDSRLLKANTFGVGQIRVRESASALVVPETAVQWNGQRHIVFLADPESDSSAEHVDWIFEARTVTIGTLQDGFAEIVTGLSAGEQIVADGSHMLKSELIRRLSSREAGKSYAEQAQTPIPMLGVDIDLSELAEQEEAYAEQISQAVASDPETQEYVEELERRADTIDELLEDDLDLPTGESLAAELSRFLRDRESDEPPPAGP